MMRLSLPAPEYLENITEEEKQIWIREHAEGIKKGLYTEDACPFYKLTPNAPIEAIKEVKNFDEIFFKGDISRSFIINPEIYDRLKDN